MPAQHENSLCESVISIKYIQTMAKKDLQRGLPLDYGTQLKMSIHFEEKYEDINLCYSVDELPIEKMPMISTSAYIMPIMHVHCLHRTAMSQF